MATHQGEAHFAPQLASIAAQTRLPAALHVCDDASTDATVAILEDYGRHAPFPVHITRATHRAGVTASFERAIGDVDPGTDVIVLCDQDDVWLPTKLERIEQELTRAPGALMAFSDAHLIDADGHRLPGRLWELAGFHPARQRRVRADPFGQLANHYLVPGCLLAFRADQRERLLPFPSQLRVDGTDLEFLHDTWITLVLSAVGEVAVIDEPLIEHRVHAGQAVGLSRRSRVRAWAPAEVRWRAVGTRTRRDLHHLRRLTDLLRVIEQRIDEQRIDDARPGFAAGDPVADVRAAIAHLGVRSGIDRPRRDRIGTVVAELRTGRYQRFSFGVSSAAADLARRPEQLPASP
jgi:glycosyltransferase involved in cell wall biosynthesis